jgi:hypothetical protein
LRRKRAISRSKTADDPAAPGPYDQSIRIIRETNQ